MTRIQPYERYATSTAAQAIGAQLNEGDEIIVTNQDPEDGVVRISLVHYSSHAEAEKVLVALDSVLV